MTELNKKEKIIGILSYLAYSAVLTFQRHYLLSLTYFACVSVGIIFADKLIKDGIVKNKTLSAFFLTAVGYQSAFEIFYTVRDDLMQILSAFAISAFFICIFLLTDKTKLPWCIGAVPFFCAINVKIAFIYCILLLCLSVMSLNKRADKLTIASMAVSAAGIIVCVIIALTSDTYFLENIGYMLERFKNPIFLIIITAYLTFKLRKSRTLKISRLCLCFAVFTVAAIFATCTLGWTAFSLFCFTLPVFTALLCLGDETVTEAIKTDFKKNKFIFFAVIICVLQ